MANYKKFFYSCYYDFDKNISYLTDFESGEISEHDNITFIYTFPDLKTKISVVFINRLDIIYSILKDIYRYEVEVTKSLTGDIQSAKKLEIKLTVDKRTIIFKNFDNLISKPEYEPLADLYKVDRKDVAMMLYLKDFGETPNRISSTLAGQSKKIFYKDIKEQLHGEIYNEHRGIRSISDWKLLYAGSKRGHMTEVAEMFFETDVVSFDINSAYAYIILTGVFPKGRFIKTTNLRNQQEIINSGKWFKVVFDASTYEQIRVDFYEKNLDIYLKNPEDKIFQALKNMIDKKLKIAAFEISDTKYYDLIGLDWKSIINTYSCYMIYSGDEGFLPDCIRDKTYDLYLKKSTFTEDCFERQQVKHQLQYIYGKAIQWKDWKSDKEVYMWYSRGENYLTPAHANHISAEIRYLLEMHQVKLQEGALYTDTDSLKFKASDKIIEYFNKVNNEIKIKNAEIGYPCDCGCWKNEGRFDKIAFFSKKCYATYNDDILDIKCSGMVDFIKTQLKTDFYKSECTFDEYFSDGMPFFTMKYNVNNLKKNESLIVYSAKPTFIRNSKTLEKALEKCFGGENYV